MSYKIIVTGPYDHGFVYDEFFFPEHIAEYNEFVKDLKELKTLLINLKIKEKRVATCIGYKKAQNNLIVKLAILESGRNNQHRHGVKCKDTAMYRCSKALVLDIYDCYDRTLKKDYAVSIYDPDFIYSKGKVIEINDYDDNDEEMCTRRVDGHHVGVTGIYYYLSEECAKMWYIANPNLTGYYTGPFKKWGADGVLDECGDYLNGLKHGEWIFYDCNSKCYFSNGVRISKELE